MAKVSVLLPVYNGCAYLSDAIESILNQSYQDWELIICDDGSQDASYDLCVKYCESDRRISLYRNLTNWGLSRTMNRLYSCARGMYVAIQEQDDISLPQRLASEVAVLDGDADIGLVSSASAWLGDLGKIFYHYPETLIDGIQYPQILDEMVIGLYLETYQIVNSACLFRKTVADRIPGPFDAQAKLSIDWQFFIDFAHLSRIWGIPEVLIHMRRGDAHYSLSRNTQLLQKEAVRCVEVIHAKYKDNPNSPINDELYERALRNVTDEN